MGVKLRAGLADVKLRFRAVCLTDNKAVGRFKSTETEALADLEAHRKANPGHDVDIEIEQRMFIMARIDQ